MFCTFAGLIDKLAIKIKFVSHINNRLLYVAFSAEKLRGLEILLLYAGSKTRNAGLLDHRLLFTRADRAMAYVVIMLRLGVSGDNAFEVTEDHLTRSLGNDVIRHNRGLSAAARRVDDKSRDAVAGSMAAKSFHYLYAL